MTVESATDQRLSPHRLVVNDDGHVFLWADDDLTTDHLRRYLQSYCRPAVSAVAYCVGDMSWPTMYPTTVGTHYREIGDPTDIRRTRLYRNAARFETEPGGYFGATFRILKELGKPILASFRMNDAHLASPENPFVSDFWKSMAESRLGDPYGYYGGCLDYGVSAVREHFHARVMEFVDLYPEIDGVELDAMRSPFFFAQGEGERHAPEVTDLMRQIKAGLGERAAERGRRPYLLTANLPLSPELALASGLDAASWDDEKLLDWISVGPYHTHLDLPIEDWKRAVPDTTVTGYVGVSPQTGQYLGIEEYRAVATSLLGAGAEGLYLFNLPCLHELSLQMPGPAPDFTLPDLRAFGHPDLSRIGELLDELGDGQFDRRSKRYLFHWSIDDRYRHFAPVLPGSSRGQPILATFGWHEHALDPSAALTMQFKIANVSRFEEFAFQLNDREIEAGAIRTAYAPNGRDVRLHTAVLEPYRVFTIRLAEPDLVNGMNTLRASPTTIDADLATSPQLCELEIRLTYDEGATIG